MPPHLLLVVNAVVPIGPPSSQAFLASGRGWRWLSGRAPGRSRRSRCPCPQGRRAEASEGQSRSWQRSRSPPPHRCCPSQRHLQAPREAGEAAAPAPRVTGAQSGRRHRRRPSASRRAARCTAWPPACSGGRRAGGLRSGAGARQQMRSAAGPQRQRRRPAGVSSARRRWARRWASWAARCSWRRGRSMEGASSPWTHSLVLQRSTMLEARRCATGSRRWRSGSAASCRRGRHAPRSRPARQRLRPPTTAAATLRAWAATAWRAFSAARTMRVSAGAPPGRRLDGVPGALLARPPNPACRVLPPPTRPMLQARLASQAATWRRCPALKPACLTLRKPSRWGGPRAGAGCRAPLHCRA